MAFDLSLSKSARRLCAYARDIGEILLNMMVLVNCLKHSIVIKQNQDLCYPLKIIVKSL